MNNKVSSPFWFCSICMIHKKYFVLYIIWKRFFLWQVYRQIRIMYIMNKSNYFAIYNMFSLYFLSIVLIVTAHLIFSYVLYTVITSTTDAARRLICGSTNDRDANLNSKWLLFPILKLKSMQIQKLVVQLHIHPSTLYVIIVLTVQLLNYYCMEMSNWVILHNYLITKVHQFTN